MLRAKFFVSKKESGLVNDGLCVTLNPVYGDDPENKSFFEATPSGEINIGVVSKEAFEKLELGKAYYVDFIPAPK